MSRPDGPWTVEGTPSRAGARFVSAMAWSILVDMTSPAASTAARSGPYLLLNAQGMVTTSVSSRKW